MSEKVSGSFRDPSGFMFKQDSKLYRQVNQKYHEEYDLLMTSGLYDQLIKSKTLVAHTEVDLDLAPMPEFAYKVIQRDVVDFISYPYEWCFNQLKDAALWFTKEVWPEVQKELGSKLYIVGSEPTEVVKALASDNVIVTGYVEDIGYYYNHCRVNVVPTRFSAGIPLKVIEAMSYGIPCVISNQISNQLSNSNSPNVIIANDSYQWVVAIKQLYSLSNRINFE